MVAVTYTFGATDTVVNTQLNQNFDDLEAALTGLDANNLADDAGIRATHLADRYCVWHDSFWLVPPIIGAGTTIIREGSTTAGQVAFEAADTDSNFYTLLSQHATFDTGQEAYLCEVELRVAHRSSNIQFRMQVNGVTVGGAAETLDTNAAYYRFRNSNPIDDPSFAIANGDVLTFDFAIPNTGGDTFRGIFIKMTFKSRLAN